MNALQELKQLLKETKRKTLPIDQIEPLIKEIDKMYIQTSKKLSGETEINKALRSVNGQLAIRLGLKIMSDADIKKMFEQNKERKSVRYAGKPKRIR